MKTKKQKTGGYRHLNRDDRIMLTALLRTGHSQADVAKSIGVHPSTISNELKRNRGVKAYHAVHADVLADKRRKESKQGSRKIEGALAKIIEDRLSPLVSPEVIAHDLKISHETIYMWIYRYRPDLKAKLPQRGRKRRRYGSKRQKKQGWTSDVRIIDARPNSANKRSSIGHFEGDTVRGKNGALLTLTDRKSRFEVAIKIPNERSDSIVPALIKANNTFKIKTCTLDRGSGFALWRTVERYTHTKTYFAHAHTPSERGTNENTNGRLRRVFPKRSDFGKITQLDVDQTVWLMNHTKRKCLNWRTPCEVFKKCCTSRLN